MNVSKLTQEYVREHPSVADCLAKGLINYSALARQICDERDLKAFDAVLVACRRQHSRMKGRLSHERKDSQLIRSAKVRVTTKMIVSFIEKARTLDRALALHRHVREDRGEFNLIEGEEVFTIVTNIDYLPKLRESFEGRVKRVSKGLAQISMLFDESLETVSGVVATLYRLFAENDINIREEMSCWTEVMVVIEEKDIGRAMQALSNA